MHLEKNQEICFKNTNICYLDMKEVVQRKKGWKVHWAITNGPGRCQLGRAWGILQDPTIILAV